VQSLDGINNTLPLARLCPVYQPIVCREGETMQVCYLSMHQGTVLWLINSSHRSISGQASWRWVSQHPHSKPLHA
jgi:hypothetical protein